MILRLATSTETSLQASKWLSSQALIDAQEMEQLLKYLGEFGLYRCGGLTPVGQEELSQAEFLLHYDAYIASLKAGILPAPSSYQPWFSPAMSATSDALFAIPLPNNKQLIRIAKPVIQLQAHTLDFSPLDKKFRSMVFGSDNIPWGIQFSYPQIYQDPISKQVIQIKDTHESPNAKLFHALQRWMRQNTIPTPFYVDEVVYNVPMRLGKNCLAWINNHPQLKSKGITVKAYVKN